jgi:hypothetical protein
MHMGGIRSGKTQLNGSVENLWPILVERVFEFFIFPKASAEQALKLLPKLQQFQPS